MKMAKHIKLLILFTVFSSSILGQKLSIRELDSGKLIMELDSSLLGRDILITSQIDRGDGLIGRAIPGMGIIRMVNRGSNKVALQQRIYPERCSATNMMDEAFQVSNQPINKKISGTIKCTTLGDRYTWEITDLIYANREFRKHGFKQLKYLSNKKPQIDSIFYHENSVIVFFTAYYLKNREEFTNAINCTGIIPVQFSCAFSILSKDRMKPLIQSLDIPLYRTIAYSDFGISTHGTVDQWIIEHWNPSKLPLLEIEHHCPNLYVEAISEEIDFYNRLLESAGCSTKFIIHKLAKNEQSAGKQLLISYDYGLNNISTYYITDSLNGEILFGRLNIGDGAFRGKLNENIWISGMNEPDVLKEPYNNNHAKQVIRNTLRKELLVLFGFNKNYQGDINIQDILGFAYGNQYNLIKCTTSSVRTLQESKDFLNGLLFVASQLNSEFMNKNPNYTLADQKGLVELGYDFYASGLANICKAIIYDRNYDECLCTLYSFWCEKLQPQGMISSLVHNGLISVNRMQAKLVNQICKSLFTESICDILLANNEGRKAIHNFFNRMFNSYNSKEKLSLERMEINYKLLQSFMILYTENSEKTTDLALRLTFLRDELKHQMYHLSQKHRNLEMRMYYDILTSLLKNEKANS